jgi:hypothetical protein
LQHLLSVVLYSDANYQTTKLSNINFSTSGIAWEGRETLLESSRMTLQSKEKHAVTRKRAAKDNGVEISRQPNLNLFF